MAETTYTSDQIRAEIKRLVANVTEREPDEISDTAHYMDELGVDSLMAMEVMIAVDKKFKIDIPEEEFNKATNVDESVAMVEQWLAVRNGTAATTA
jgi:acyl carrier protein